MQRIARFHRFARDRRGMIMPLAAFLICIMLGFVAFTVDIGFINLTKTQLQAAADASALSGALELSGTDDPAEVRANARQAIVQTGTLHRNGNLDGVAIDPIADVTFGRMVWNGNSQTYQLRWGENETPHNVIKVRTTRAAGNNANGGALPLFFAPAIGNRTANITAEAVATFQPRDIMVVLDFSASMNDDSALEAIGRLGRTAVESNLQTMWTELGSPIHGNLAFTPKYATLKGQAASGAIPHIDVTYRGNSIYVVSTKDLSNVVLKFTDGVTYKFDGLSGKTGTFQGNGSNSGKRIATSWVKSGSNSSGDGPGYGEKFDFTSTNIKTALGLTGTYPYPSGSWSEYISKVQSSSGDIKNAGYRDMYGYLTWIEYLQTVCESSAETPDLWKTSEQPVGAMKNAVDLFIDYLKIVEAEDNVGLSIYTHPNSVGAILEHGLTQNITQISNTVRQRQAGHYHSMTNISAGMKVARQELVANARPRTFRMMVLMTDGLPNLPSSAWTATQAVITEANLAAAERIKILTISLGTNADSGLMQQVADITGGVHFNVPGGSSIEEMRTQLQNVFREIAASRPLKLISGQ